MEAENILFLVLASLPVALVIFGVAVVKNKVLFGRLLGLGVMIISPILSILYIDRFLCTRPGVFCELTGIFYIMLIIEAMILILLFFGLGFIIQKRLQ